MTVSSTVLVKWEDIRELFLDKSEVDLEGDDDA
jgi:hypothetical protein